MPKHEAIHRKITEEQHRVIQVTGMRFLVKQNPEKYSMRYSKSGLWLYENTDFIGRMPLVCL